MTSRYPSAHAFRRALEERLLRHAQTGGGDLMRLRRGVAFERLLARLFRDPQPPWLLKGGYSLEVRLHHLARATKDIDLTIPQLARLGAPDPDLTGQIRARLQAALDRDLGDWFVLRAGAPLADLDAAPYGGARFPIDTRLAGRTFAAFHVDVAAGDALVGVPDLLTGHDLLAFAGLAPAQFLALPTEQHFAEKIHAYTRPRGAALNSRVKDLLDLLLLIQAGLPPPERVRQAVAATFARRQTHPIPPELPPPPATWAAPYAALAADGPLPVPPWPDAYPTLAAYWHQLTF